MAGNILIQRTGRSSKNYWGYLLFGQINVSWLTQPIVGALSPGEYEIPVDQRDNLDWFNDNGIEFDQFGRLHVQQLMSSQMPDTVILV